MNMRNLFESQYDDDKLISDCIRPDGIILRFNNDFIKVMEIFSDIHTSSIYI